MATQKPTDAQKDAPAQDAAPKEADAVTMPAGTDGGGAAPTAPQSAPKPPPERPRARSRAEAPAMVKVTVTESPATPSLVLQVNGRRFEFPVGKAVTVPRTVVSTLRTVTGIKFTTE